MELNFPENVEISGLAFADAVEEFEWYFQRSEKAAYAFLRELVKAVRQAAEKPTQWPRYFRKARYVRIRRYPIIVIYEIKRDRIRIVAIAHGKVRGKHWRDRIS